MTRHANPALVEHKAFPFELVKALSDTGDFEGYASTWTEDLVGDRIQRGAFKRTLQHWQDKGRPIPVMWQHDPTQPIGVTTSATEDDRGLHVQGRLLMGISKAREAYEAANANVLGGLSIGFSIPKDGATFEDDGTRLIREARLFEYSLVTWPANEAAVLTGLKAVDPVQDAILAELRSIRKALLLPSDDGPGQRDAHAAPATSSMDTLLAELRAITTPHT